MLAEADAEAEIELYSTLCVFEKRGAAGDGLAVISFFFFLQQ